MSIIERSLRREIVYHTGRTTKGAAPSSRRINAQRRGLKLRSDVKQAENVFCGMSVVMFG